MSQEGETKEATPQENSEETTNEVQLSPVEAAIQERAKTQGWRPIEEWEGDPADFIDAREFVRRGELFEKIDSQRKEMQGLRKALDAMKEHYGKVREVEFQNALETLKQQKADALREGDADKVVALDEAIDAEKDKIALAKATAMREKQQAQQSGELHPTFAKWLEKNRWFAEDPEMHDFAEALGASYSKTHPRTTPEEVLKIVRERTMQAFPHKFSNPNRDKATAVEGGEGTRTAAKGTSKNDVELTDQERQVMNRLVKNKVLTEAEYIADIRKLRQRAN